MHVHLSQRGRVTATLLAIFLVMPLMAALLPRATATTITSIDPISGHVGDIVRVVGEIDTANGSYTIFFNGGAVKTGTAVETAVNDTFVVPHRPIGGYNVTLQDVATPSNATSTFTVETAYYVEAVTPQPPEQLQQGESTQILVNVTGGEENTVYSANITVTEPSGGVYNYTLQLTNTTSTGYGEGIITYPVDFDFDASTDYVGTYSLRARINESLEAGDFTVGLTDRVEYGRGGTVTIQGSGYDAKENVTVNITLAGVPIAGYPKNVTANDDGVATDSWAIPTNAKPGVHTVTLANATSGGTVKTPVDAQNFTVVGAICLIQTWNLADPPEPMAGVIVEASNATTTDWSPIAGTTNKTGWVELWLELDNYTFEAFYMIDKDFVLVGRLENQSIAEAATFKLNLTCQLSHIKITIRDEARNPLPNIDIKLAHTYTTRGNLTVAKTEHFETNNTGIVTILNTVANTSYEIEASRYGHPFNRTVIENLTFPLWINITCPTYTVFIHVLDSHDLPIQNVDVAFIEWSSEILIDAKPTNTMGSVAFSYIFGRYRARVYSGSALQEDAVVLNETVINLIEDQFFVLIYCKIYNIDLSLSVIDYFGQPIPNAVVKVERNGLEFTSPSTGKDGTTSLLGIIGGDSRVSVYISGRLGETRTSYLDRDGEIVFRMGKYIVIGGYPLESIQFLAIISLSILVAIFAMAILYRRISLTRKKKERDEGNTQRE